MNETHVAIIGGGITGLAAAHALERARRTGKSVKYTVIEAQNRLGGIIRTDRVDGFLLDAGPESFLKTKPHAIELARQVGLQDRLIETRPETRRVYIVRNGQLVPMPDGIILTAPSRLRSFVSSRLFSPQGKARMALDLAIAAKRDDGDESIASFVRRRLGQEAVELLAQPLLAGIYSGDAERLSIHATFPQLVAMERSHGGLIRGARALRKEREQAQGTNKPASAFTTPLGGVGELVDAVASNLTVGSVRLDSKVTAIARVGERWRLSFASGEDLSADRIIMSVPARIAATLLAPFDSTLGATLASVRHVSSGSVFLAWDRAEIPHSLDATGFLAPRTEGLEVIGSTWVSSKWEGRAPEGAALFRVFIGGAHPDTMLARSDEALVAIACEALRKLVGVKSPPRLARVYRHLHSNPQPDVGHADRLKDIVERSKKIGGIALAAGGYGGWGLSDCIKQGLMAATQWLEEIR